MADSDESVELLFFDTFSHDINEVNYDELINRIKQCCNQVKRIKFLWKLQTFCHFYLAS